MTIKPADVILAVYKVTGVSLSEMCGNGRHKAVTDAKAIAGTIMHERLHMTWPEVARFFCKKSHSTFCVAAHRLQKRGGKPLDHLWEVSRKLNEMERGHGDH